MRARLPRLLVVPTLLALADVTVLISGGLRGAMSK